MECRLYPKVIRILSHLEFQPCYGKRIADKDPTCFASEGYPRPGPGQIYQAMKLLEKRELIQRLHNYVPTLEQRGKHPQTLSRAVWYTLTDKGRKALHTARVQLGTCAVLPHKRRSPQVPRRKTRQKRRDWHAK